MVLDSQGAGTAPTQKATLRQTLSTEAHQTAEDNHTSRRRRLVRGETVARGDGAKSETWPAAVEGGISDELSRSRAAIMRGRRNTVDLPTASWDLVAGEERKIDIPREGGDMRGRYKISLHHRSSSTARSGKTNDVASPGAGPGSGGCGPRLFSGTYLFEKTLLLTLRWRCLISHGDDGGAKGRQGGEDDDPTATRRDDSPWMDHRAGAEEIN
ncbi:hypothetical protein THAOC_35597 [Thalassiosira oceanica]|uniref:Uncharacterized protein n=1 Tax=Thalassiosira oceanica TaxID=159749 RepID=K0R0N6_THAOC|nr:hypothetical protein THAOC_35597 [Thalassiosira oceanica]|eukprot:EJK45773.1 hypothetical protein THAOC_35597 [Thalassiosira oceanica]